ncbi:MAG: amino acid permease [Gammaproteobacteria bacterium]|nr:amino acid permease [Gammaproteobacteria bacterium]MBQ0841070.1 amino acid permease [Gammaproteobacteria bacterium]
MQDGQGHTKETKLTLKEVIAMGIGGMVGGGIFSVLGLAIAQAGHAAPFAFAFGGIIALLTGLSYARLGAVFQSSGGSFTFLEHAFENQNVAAMGGWLLLAGYIGTMSLYAYTFGVYGGAMLGDNGNSIVVHHFLETLILLTFLGVNLYGIKASGSSELMIVTVKMIILFLFSVIGLFYVKEDHILPVFNQGYSGVVMAAALIFVAYEGFELIPNAINEMEDPQRNLKPAIIWSIAITSTIYILVSSVAVGNLLPEEISRYKEYALAVAAKPFLGDAGFLLIGLAALFSTASAINATMFGTARLGMIMATEKALPKAFGFRRKQNNIPWVSLVVITSCTVVFVNLADLTIISSFASSTFLLIFTLINFSAWRLRRTIGGYPLIPLLGMVLSLSSWLALIYYLWNTNEKNLLWIGAIYIGVCSAEFLICQRRFLFKKNYNKVDR